MKSYEVLKNRLNNGVPFTVSSAKARIVALADALEITQEQTDELLTLAERNGSDNLLTVEERLDALEAKALELEMRDLEHDSAIMELASLMEGDE